MKKLYIIILVVLCIGWVVSCPSYIKSDSSTSESEGEDYQDQMTINEDKIRGSIEYNDSIEKLYQYLISRLLNVQICGEIMQKPK